LAGQRVRPRPEGSPSVLTGSPGHRIVRQPCDGGIRPRPSEGSPSRATSAARPVGFRRPRGHGCRLAGPRVRPRPEGSPSVLTGSPGHRVVSGREGQCRVGCRRGWLEGHVRRSAGGLPPAEGAWVPLGRAGGGGRSPGSLNSERWLGLPTSGAGDDVGSAMPSAREQPRAGMTSSSPTRRLRSAFCMKESIDVAGIGSRSVRPGCPARRGARSVRRWRAGG